MKLSDVGEFGLIAELKKLSSSKSSKTYLGIGDDAAAILTGEKELTLLSIDSLLEDIHFDLNYFSYFQLGWRAATANLSDIAAMGGKPSHLLTSIALPENQSVENVVEIYKGINELCSQHGIEVIGGDTTKSANGLVLSFTSVGTVEKVNLKKRSDAKDGDAILVTGAPGESKAGFEILQRRLTSSQSLIDKHLIPSPRVNESLFLVSTFDINAMIDVSDGIASEINHICRQSNLGAIIEAKQIPLSQDLSEIAGKFGNKALNYALYGGEDYELLFTVPEDNVSKLCSELQDEFALPCTKIGQITASEEKPYLKNANGELFPLLPKGWQHF